MVGQPLSVGVKGGIPFTDFLETVSGDRALLSSSQNHYIVGPTFELRLPAGFAVEIDLLYRRFSYNLTTTLVNGISSARTTGNDWEFPLLVKKRFSSGQIRPFVDAGLNFNKIGGLKQSIQSIVSGQFSNVTNSSKPPELKNDFSTGFVAGVGLELNLLFLKISPEIRYTRWGAERFSSVFSTGSLNSNQNQGEFLVGFSF